MSAKRATLTTSTGDAFAESTAHLHCERCGGTQEIIRPPSRGKSAERRGCPACSGGAEYATGNGAFTYAVAVEFDKDARLPQGVEVQETWWPNWISGGTRAQGIAGYVERQERAVALLEEKLAAAKRILGMARELK